VGEPPKIDIPEQDLPVSYPFMVSKAIMLLGQYPSSIDDDLSLVIPGPLREICADGAYITRGFDKNLMLMSERVFRERYQRIKALNIADPVARLLVRLILGNASRIEFDHSGRFSIPSELMASADLEKEVRLVGLGDTIEIWSPSNWEKQSSLLQNTDANSEKFTLLDLALD
jgi:MraZ protein